MEPHIAVHTGLHIAIHISLHGGVHPRPYSTYPQSEDVYDPDRDFVPLFDFSAPLTGFGDDFEDEDGETHTLNNTCKVNLGQARRIFGSL